MLTVIKLENNQSVSTIDSEDFAKANLIFRRNDDGTYCVIKNRLGSYVTSLLDEREMVDLLVSIANFP